MRALPAFLNHRKLRKIDLAVLPDMDTQKATKGEQPAAGTARFLDLTKGHAYEK
jgi:hypothetical protein